MGICGETQKLRMKRGTRKREEAVRKIRKYAGVFAEALFSREVFTSASFPVRLYFFGRLLKISAAIRKVMKKFLSADSIKSLLYCTIPIII